MNPNTKNKLIPESEFSDYCLATFSAFKLLKISIPVTISSRGKARKRFVLKSLIAVKSFLDS